MQTPPQRVHSQDTLVNLFFGGREYIANDRDEVSEGF